MRKIKIIPGEYYHVFNRGNNKQNIFREKKDWCRLLFLILYFQSPTVFYNIGRYVSYFVRYLVFNISKENLDKILNNKTIELINFVLMPNHFHMILKEKQNNGISKYMQRVQEAYSKYFNTKYGTHGHLFQGTFKIVHIKNNEQLLHLSAYIHRNPREIKEWKNKELQYYWSSFQDYVSKNRWEKLLEQKIILEQFSGPKEYKNFVETSGIKLKLDEIHLLDT